MNIEYRVNEKIHLDEFIAVLNESGLAARRPIHDTTCLEGMLANSNLTVSARDGGKLIGIARSVTDFHYACYLSDLAVSEDYKNRGVGKQLQIITQTQLGPQCKIILIAAPQANGYYPKIGFKNNPNCWLLERSAQIGGSAGDVEG